MASDQFEHRAISSVGPATGLVSVTPSDSADLPDGLTRSLFVGAAGDLEVLDAAGRQARIVSAAHQYHPVRIRRVLASGTTAGSILALY